MSFLGDPAEAESIAKLLEAIIAGLVVLGAVALISETPAYPLAYGIVAMALMYVVLHGKPGFLANAAKMVGGATNGKLF